MIHKNLPIQLKINIIAQDRPGFLAEITSVLSKDGFNLLGVMQKLTRKQKFQCADCY